MNRAYCGRARFPGKKPFLIGTVILDARAKDHEIQAALGELWRDIFPYEAPAFEVVPGAIFFQPEGEHE